MDRLAPDALERLIKLLGMLGSAHDGERAAAGLKAHEFIKRHGLTWADVISTTPIVKTEPRQRTRPLPWQMMAQACWLRSYHLTERERVFIDNIRRWTGTPSDKQLAWLNRIYEKLA